MNPDEFVFDPDALDERAAMSPKVERSVVVLGRRLRIGGQGQRALRGHPDLCVERRGSSRGASTIFGGTR
jgi:hypothetical protein